jgi:hypothetical protein
MSPVDRAIASNSWHVTGRTGGPHVEPKPVKALGRRAGETGAGGRATRNFAKTAVGWHRLTGVHPQMANLPDIGVARKI